jgi:membrane fusion protein (multidrug efflux system)
MLGNDVLIHSGLAVGEHVAASGSFKLREGVLIAAAPHRDERPAEDHVLSKR